MAEKLPYHFPVIIGWDLAGVVEKVGPAVTWFKPGDRAYGYIRRHHLQFGTYAERDRARGLLRAHAARTVVRGGSRAAADLADRPPGARGARPARRRDALPHRRRRRRRPRGDPARGRARGARDRHRVRQPRLRARARGRPLDYARATTWPTACTTCSTREPTRSNCSAPTSASRPSPRCARAAGSPRSPSRRRRPVGATRSPTSSCARAASCSANTSRRWWPRAACAPTIEDTFPLERAADAHERIEEGHVRYDEAGPQRRLTRLSGPGSGCYSEMSP